MSEGLKLKVNADDARHILLEVAVDGEPTWAIAIHDDREDGLHKDPILLVFLESEEEPRLALHYKED